MQVWLNGKFYIGKSNNLKTRYRQYRKRHHNPYAKKLTAKYGSPKFYIVATTSTRKNLSDLESHYIDLFFNDQDNINFCRAKEVYKESYIIAAQKDRGRISIWCTNVWTYAPFAFKGWASVKNFFGISYTGKIYRRYFLFGKTKKELRQRWHSVQQDLRARPSPQNNKTGQTFFQFEDRYFATCREAYEYSLLPVSFSYFQKGLFKTYRDYIRQSYGTHRIVTFDGLKFISTKQAYLYAIPDIKVHYHWFLIMFYKAGADTIRKMQLLLNQPRNRSPGGAENVFVKHTKTEPCYSSYLVGYCGKRWYPNLSEAERNGVAKSKLKFIPHSNEQD
jgi:hypothetical protein